MQPTVLRAVVLMKFLFCVVCNFYYDAFYVESYGLSLRLPRKSVVRLTDCLDMTIVVDWDVKQHSNKQTNMLSLTLFLVFMLSCLA